MSSQEQKDDFIEISWTSGSLDEARKISRYLVQERYVASAQIIPWIESIYMLDNQLDAQQESRIVLKTRSDFFNQVREIIEKNSKYEVPEITYIKIAGGNQHYLDWLQESTTQPQNQI